MDGSDKSASSSSTTKKPPSIPKGTDANDQIFHEMGLNAHNSKKMPSSTVKHFMSPTISAASKANPARKKVLAEKNESFDGCLQKSPNLDSNTMSTFEFGENQENAHVDDLSSRPYDPLTNYLSPRPKFLRYKPNRRRQIILPKENGVKRGHDGLGLSVSSTGSSGSIKDFDGEGSLNSSCCSLAIGCQESDAKQDEEIDESDDEYEEIEEEGSWGLRGVLKFLLVMFVLVLSTSYISSMNSPTPSPVVKAVKGFNDGFHMIQDHVYGFVKGLEIGNYFLFEREGTQMCMIDSDGIEGEGIVNYESTEVIEQQSGETEVAEGFENGEKVATDEFGESETTETVEHEDKAEKHGGEIGVVGEIENGEKVAVDECDERGEREAMETVEHEYKAEKLSGEIEVVGAIESGEKAAVDECDESVESEALETVEHAEISVVKYLQALETANVSDLEMAKIREGFDQDDAGNAQSQGMGFESFDILSMHGDSQVVREPIQKSMVDGGMSRIRNITDDYNIDHETPIDEAEGNPKKGILEHMDSESVLKAAAVGVSIVSSFIATLVVASHFKRKRNSRKKTSLSPVVETHFESVKAEKCSPVLANEKDNNMERFASLAKSKSLIISKEIQFKEEMSQTQTPSIEFLGEFEVEAMSSSSHRRNWKPKGRMIESEVSSYSVSMDKGISSYVQSAPVHIKPVLSEISTMNFSSYGRSTNARKIASEEKQQGGDREVRKVVATSVRRSSRIRNRAVTSP